MASEEQKLMCKRAGLVETIGWQKEKVENYFQSFFLGVVLQQ